MTKEQIASHFASIQEKLTADGWDWEMASPHCLRINGDVPGAIVYDQWFGFHATCNAFKQYLC